MLTTLRSYNETSNKLYSHETPAGTTVIKCYQGSDAVEHREREKRKLLHWKNKGHPVPAVLPLEIDELSNDIYLVLEYLPGLSLQQILCDKNISMEQREDILTDTLILMAKRHHQAIADHDRHLIHYDANTGNIVISNNKAFWIDFEAPLPQGTTMELASLEIAKFIRWAVRDLGQDRLEPCIDRLVYAYRDQLLLLHNLANRTLRRNFSFYHRYRDRKKKKKYPREVTKYDIADAIAMKIDRGA
jgi:tRNA A-37 threonylcarbamoyl transferase component Bud32